MANCIKNYLTIIIRRRQSEYFTEHEENNNWFSFITQVLIRATAFICFFFKSIKKSCGGHFEN